MCHRRLFNGEDFDRFSRTQKKPHRGRHMHGMCMETRADTHIDAPTCVPVKLANLNKCGCGLRAHTRAHSTCRLVLPHYYGWQGVSGPLLFSKGSL